MQYPLKKEIPYEEIENGALILLLLRECKTWEELCSRYAYTEPAQITTNTNTMMLLNKLFAMRDLGLLGFAEQVTESGRMPVGEIKETDLCSKIRVAFGGMSLFEVAMIPRGWPSSLCLGGRPRRKRKSMFSS